MLQEKEMQQRFQTIEQAIGLAAQASSVERDLPRELRDCIARLDRQSDLVRQAMRSCDELLLRQAIGELEALGGRAKLVCASGARLTLQMKDAVLWLHSELAALSRHMQ